jgi:hypothetical protein
MKLSSVQAQRLEQQIDAQIIPDDHALLPQLERAFGRHTFFLDSEGLNIVEPSPSDRQIGNVVKLANWIDDRHTTLEPSEPEPMPLEIRLGPAGRDGSEGD